MAKSKRARERTGLPAPSSVLMEFAFTAPARPAVRGVRRARAPTEYRVLRTDQVDEYERPVSLTALLAAARRPPGDLFRGESRRAAKISIADAEFEEFDDLRDLIASLPEEAEMTHHDPPITRKPTSKRVLEERRNVRVRAFLFAASREDDNDFHLIVGRSPSSSPLYMTMEVSGLPPSSSRHRKALKRARDAYKSFFDQHPLGLPGASYDFYDPPVPLEIGGSLFFDISHVTGGRPGPEDLRDDIPTVWEVHPVTRIVFEP